jgi:hypothetical protein
VFQMKFALWRGWSVFWGNLRQLEIS